MPTDGHGEDTSVDTLTDHQRLQERRAQLPAVDAVLRLPLAAEPSARHGRGQLATQIRAVLAEARAAIVDGELPPSADAVLASAVDALDQHAAEDLTPVINATGVVLHTNLGRAPLSDAARRAVADAAGATTIEYHLTEGRRGSRTAHVGRLAARLCGAEAATVVNNGAGALLLVLAALATDRQVVVSRGELIEIGGSFRLPDLIPAAGAHLVEVGTANRTRTEDYARALDATRGLVLKVHRANHRVIGFTEEASLAELAQLTSRQGVPLVYDLGSGLVRGTYDGAVPEEPSVETSLAAGADLVIFSGDKLLGGPQAGLVVGRADLVERCQAHPLARAVRIGKLQRAALEATLHAHLRAATPREVPAVAMLTADVDTLRTRAAALARAVGASAPADIRVTALDAAVGGGALPGVTLASTGLRIEVPDASAMAARLRRGTPAVVARIEDGRVLLDLRTVAADDDQALAHALRAALA